MTFLFGAFWSSIADSALEKAASTRQRDVLLRLLLPLIHSLFIFSFCIAVGIRAQAGSLRPGTTRRKLFMGAKVQLITNCVRLSEFYLSNAQVGEQRTALFQTRVMKMVSWGNILLKNLVDKVFRG
jgi:hypothetical protein